MTDAEAQGYALHQLAYLEEQQGRPEEARKLYRQKLGMTAKVKLREQELAMLTVLESVAAARKANPALLAQGAVLCYQSAARQSGGESRPGSR